MTHDGVTVGGHILALLSDVCCPPFTDTTALVMGSADATKLLRFEVDGFTAGTTRVVTPPNADITIAGTNFLNAWADGVKQTFNPDGTNAGINVGANAADPSAPVNGDLWYESTAQELRAYINGAVVALGSGGGSSPPFTDTQTIIKGSADATKLLRFEVDGFTTGTTRVITPPDSNLTLAGIDIANAWADGVTQTFNPNAASSGLNVGSHTADPAGLNNGDVWYQSTANELRARINGATVALGSGGSTPPFTDTTAIVKGSADATKLLRFEVDGFTTATTRVLTPPDADIVIAGSNFLNAWADGITQTFNPNGTNSGVNVGAHTADPSALNNGDIWYESTANELRARVNGATVSIGFGAPPFVDTTAIVKGSADMTKLLRFEVDGFTTGTTRVLTPPDASITIAGTNFLNAWADGITQTFNPDGTSSGINVGSHTADPSALNNGDVWYQSTANELRARINGATVALGSAGSSPPFTDSTSIVKGSADATKLLRFEIDGFTTGTTRVLTPPDADISLAGTNISNAWSDGVKQTFNPNGTNAGVNVGANAADPSALVNGDLWYQSTANELRAYINGAVVALGSGGSTPPFVDTQTIIKGSADATKLLRFEVDGFTTATTRVLTPPNADITIAGINIAQTFAATQTFSPAANTESIVSSGFSLTGANAQSLLNLSGTWNTSGNPTALKLNITNTASGATSLLQDLQVGGVSQWSVSKAGNVTALGSITGGNALFLVEGTTGVVQLSNGTDPGANPTNATKQWAVGGEWQYRSSAASEGAGQTNRVHNRAAEVIGAGTDYSLTTTLARIDFGTTDAQITLPTAGTYLVTATVQFRDVAPAANDFLVAQLYNSTDAVLIGTSCFCTLGTNHDISVVIQEVVTVTASKLVEIHGRNATAARGTVFSATTKISYVRLY